MDAGQWLDKACDSLLAGESVPMPSGDIARPVGDVEVCEACKGTGKDPDPPWFSTSSPPSYGADGCDVCRGRGRTRRFEVVPAADSPAKEDP